MPGKSITRRKFLSIAGFSLAGLTVTCTGAGYLATRTPSYNPIELTFGKDNPMNKRILVTYATRAGSTSEVASAIAETLAKRGFVVDVKPVKSKPGLDGYQAVVMGSAIRMGSWLPEMVDFIKKNQAALQALPTALFSVHLQNTGEDETSRAARKAYTAPMYALLSPSVEAFFQGNMDYARLSFLDRLLAKAVASQTGGSAGDHRDWEKINRWAGEIFA